MVTTTLHHLGPHVGYCWGRLDSRTLTHRRARCEKPTFLAQKPICGVTSEACAHTRTSCAQGACVIDDKLVVITQWCIFVACSMRIIAFSFARSKCCIFVASSMIQFRPIKLQDQSDAFLLHATYLTCQRNWDMSSPKKR